MGISTKVAISISVVIALGGVAALYVTLESEAREQRTEFRQTNLEALQLLSLSIAPDVAAERHDRVQAVLDNIANYPERFPDIAGLEVLDRDGWVVADLDPRRFRLLRSDDTTRRDLKLREPTVRSIDPEHWQMIVPIRLAYHLGVLRARVSDRRVEALLTARKRQAVAVVLVAVVVMCFGLILSLRRLVSQRIVHLARVASMLRRGQMDARAELGSEGGRGADEITSLGQSFNLMAEELQAYTAELEERVRDRTKRLEEANVRLSQLAMTDPLTGLFNRRHFEERSLRDLEVAGRAQRPFSVVMLDIDHFKSVNDDFGHPTGDEVLKGIADVLRTNARGADLVARIGGEEFAVAMPDASRAQALRAAERIRLGVAAERFTALGERGVTVSLGVASFPEHGSSLTSLLERADSALYRAKRQGRNRVVSAGADAEPRTGEMPT